MNYLATGINESPVIAQPAASAITDVRGRAVKFNGSGAIVLAGAGDIPLGIGLMTCGTEGAIAAGDFIDIQYKDIGYVYAGGAITAGANLSVGANGVFVTATTGGSPTAVVGIALGTASASGQFIPAILKCTAPATADAAPAVSISDLTDVDLTGLANGNVLKYDSTSEKWEAAADATE